MDVIEQKIYRWPTMVGLFGLCLGWGTFAILALRSWPLVHQMQCAFEVGWVQCRRMLLPDTREFMIIGVVALFLLLASGGWAASQFLFVKDGAQKKWPLWLPFFASLFALAAFVILPFGSSDMLYYFGAGDAVSRGINPYTESWERPTMARLTGGEDQAIQGFAYGPIMLSSFSLLVQLSGHSPFVFVWVWKALMVASIIVMALIFCRLLQEQKLEISPVWLLTIFFLQPLLLFEWIGNGHFDSLWIIPTLLALWAAKKSKWVWVALWFCLGIWIKFLPALIAPWFVLWWWQERREQSGRKIFSEAVAIIGITLVLTIVSWWPYWSGLSTIKPILLQTKWAVMSVFASLYYTFKPAFVFFFHEQAHWVLTRFVHAGLFGVGLWLGWPILREMWGIVRGKVRWSMSQYSLAIFVSLCLYMGIWQKSFWPWYPLWLLPFALLAWQQSTETYIFRFMRWLMMMSFVFYPVWFATWHLIGVDAAPELWFSWIITLVVWLIPLVWLWQWRRKSYSITGK